MKEKLLFLDPSNYQCIAIASMLLQYSNGKYQCFGNTFEMSSFSKFLIPKNIFQAISENTTPENLRRLSSQYTIIGGGMLSTSELIEVFGDIKLSSVSLTKSSLDVMEKHSFLQKAVEAGVPIPKTYSSSSEIKNYPVFFKDDTEATDAQKIKGIANSKSELPENESGVLFQEYLTHPSTFGFGFIAKSGKVLCAQQHEETLSYPKIGGSAVYIKSFEDKKIQKYSEDLIKKFNYSGWGLVEFKRNNADNDYELMEINPKFWASVEFSLRKNPLFMKLLFDVETLPESFDAMVFKHRSVLSGYSKSDFNKNANQIVAESWTSWKYHMYAQLKKLTS